MMVQNTKKLKDRQWCERLMRTTWYSITVILFAELIIYFFRRLFGEPLQVDYILYYAVWPGLMNFSMLGIVHLISSALIGKYAFGKQAIVYVCGVSAICTCIAWTHRDLPVIHSVFLIPVLVSMVYVGKKPLHFAFILNAALYVAYLLVMFFWEIQYMVSLLEIGAMLIIMLIVYNTANLVLTRQRELAQDMIDASNLSMMDSLTKLYNHASFYEQLDEHILRDSRGEGGFCLVVFDIDDFKKVNDGFGHDVGDEVLLSLVEAIKGAISGNETAFRYGGEEFTILTGKNIADTYQLVEKIRASFVKIVHRTYPQMHISVSAGLCAFDGRVFSGRREFFAAADEALYEAKRTGKNKAVIWSHQLLERLGEQITRDKDGDKADD